MRIHLEGDRIRPIAERFAKSFGIPRNTTMVALGGAFDLSDCCIRCAVADWGIARNLHPANYTRGRAPPFYRYASCRENDARRKKEREVPDFRLIGSRRCCVCIGTRGASRWRISALGRSPPPRIRGQGRSVTTPVSLYGAIIVMWRGAIFFDRWQFRNATFHIWWGV